MPSAPSVQGRPELRDRLSETLADERTSVIGLQALSADEAGQHVESLGWELDADARRAIVGRAGGSPLFLEEVATMAAEEGVAAGVPRTVRTLIAARLDLLPPDVKRAAQAAAVVGDVFWDGTLAALDGGELPAAALRQLRTRGFVEEVAQSTFLGTREFRFHHALVREVTYDSLAKRERARLHGLAAAWLEERARDRPELAVAIARHRERAVSLLRDVAPLEPLDPTIVEGAARALV
jgi:predicted ATPase